jgi:HAD superfamily hydrolase (TIGR01509 family)
MLQAVIFDLDGLLADTEGLHCKAYVAALAEVGVILTDSEYAEHWIRRGLGITDLCSQRGLAHDPFAIRARKAVLYEQLVRSELQPMPGAHALVATLRPHFALAVGTSSFRDAAELVLSRLGLDFEVVATVTELHRPKPSPDIFLEAARRLGVEPRQCVVVEDAEKGLIAAQAAGMPCVAVPNAHTRDHDFSKAALVVDSLDRLSVANLLDLSRRLF